MVAADGFALPCSIVASRLLLFATSTTVPRNGNALTFWNPADRTFAARMEKLDDHRLNVVLGGDWPGAGNLFLFHGMCVGDVLGNGATPRRAARSVAWRDVKDEEKLEGSTPPAVNNFPRGRGVRGRNGGGDGGVANHWEEASCRSTFRFGLLAMASGGDRGRDVGPCAVRREEE